MIMTPKMWGLSQRILHLEWLYKCDPYDYMIKFELEELQIEYNRLERIEKIGLKVVQGGRQSSNSSTNKSRQVS